MFWDKLQATDKDELIATKQYGKLLGPAIRGNDLFLKKFFYTYYL
jgi:hypothetical protein